MVISKLNIDKIGKTLSLIQECIVELKKLSMMQKKEFLSDKRNPAAVELGTGSYFLTKPKAGILSSAYAGDHACVL